MPTRSVRGRVPSSTRGRRRPRPGIGLALAGGGPLGGIYEVGALLALSDSLSGLRFNDLDVYVGVSSGSYIAAAMANGLSPAQMYRLFIEEGIDSALRPEIFLRPALAEFSSRVRSLPYLLARASLQYLRDPLHHGLMESFATLGRAMPSGVFDNAAIDTVLSDLFKAPGRTNDFRRLERKLYVVATNLDSGSAVTFGEPGFDHVPISRAIEASSALPGLFPPVRIDGEFYVDGALNKTLHASVALDHGIGLLLCINPLVPFDANKAQQERPNAIHRLNRYGLPLVLSQTFRAIIHSRMRVGMNRYRLEYPDADIVLFEPDRADADMFFTNLFSYAQRKRLCAAAFQKIRQNLLARSGELGPQFARHGITLLTDRLKDPNRKITDAVHDPRPLHASHSRSGCVAQTARDLDYTLDQLEHWLRTSAQAGAHG